MDTLEKPMLYLKEKEEALSDEPMPQDIETSPSVKLVLESSAEVNAIGIAFTHRLRTVHFGGAAQFVGEAGIALGQDGILFNCTCCGKPEIPQRTLICDACENSFHMKCMKIRENQVSDIDDWLCTSCAMKQEKHKWTLGRINPGQHVTNIGSNVNCKVLRECKVEIDNDAILVEHSTPTHGVPSTDGNQRENNKRQKRDEDDDFGANTSLSKKPSDGSRSESRFRTTRLKSLSGAEDGHVTIYGLERASMMDTLFPGDMDASQTSATASSKDLDDEVEPSFRDIDSGAIGQHHMQRLKEFLSEKGGTIDEDWRVEVKKRVNTEKTFDVTFFSPDGQKFRSRPEVARFLGILDQKKDGKVVDADPRDLSTPATRKKRKEVFREQRQDEVSTVVEQSNDYFLESVKRQKSESYNHSEPQDPILDLEIQLPFQCMDLKIENIGNLEMRPGYYNDDIMWPIGYRCSWHDGITGSICVSEVLDGGPFHPVFKISRKSCSLCSDMLLDSKSSKQDTLQPQEQIAIAQKQQEESLETGKNLYTQFNHVYDEDDELSMLVGNLSAFNEESTRIGEGWNMWSDRYGAQDQYEVCSVDQIGELTVESSSSSGAWKLFAERMLERINEVLCMGRCKLGCKHIGNSHSSKLKVSLPANAVGLKHGEIDVEEAYINLLDWLGEDRFGFDVPVIRKYLQGKMANLKPLRPPPPIGSPICKSISEFAGDLLQIWEFLCRFSDILGQKEPPLLEDLEAIVVGTSEMGIGVATYRKGEELQPKQRLGRTKQISSSGCCNVALASSNIALLKIALSDLQQIALVAGPDLVLDAKRSKKKDGEGAVAPKKRAGSLVILNELTWPEVARRYVIGLLALRTCVENIDVSAQDRRKILHCIQGDGGNLCGALAGVAAIEADALLLATAEKHLSRWLLTGDEIDMTESLHEDDSGETPVEDDIPVGTSAKPPWATALEPVRKLATNVGARIRNCIRDALDLNPPDWAKEVLEWSISKDIYKGNASGPTKKAVLSVLDKVSDEKQASLPIEEKKIEYVCPTPVRVMKRCRVILRQIIAPDDVRDFCNSLGGTVLGYFEDEEDNIEMSLPLITRPLDFRMIDARLAAGAYGGSHESYAADMRQLFQNVPIVFKDREDFIKVAEQLSQQFESLYEEKVLRFLDGKEEIMQESDVSTMSINSIEFDKELRKAPWEEGVCKICGIDKDDDSTLLCDGCDAEYHIYCLVPPLSMIPEGNWYCPSCVAQDKNSSTAAGTGSLSAMPVMLHQQNRLLGDEANLPSLVASMSGQDYWQLSPLERVQLLKFLCDKVLESTIIRDHIDQSIEALPELQQRLRQLLIEKQTLVNKMGSRFDEVATGAMVKDQSGTHQTLQTRNGNTSIQDTVNITSLGYVSNVAGHGPTIQNETLKTVHASFYAPATCNLGNRSNGSLHSWGPSNQSENNPYLHRVHMEGGNAIPQSNAPSTLIQTGVELIEAEIDKVEAELMKLAPRREVLGRDNLGRIYWGLGWMGKFPWLVVEVVSETDVPQHSHTVVTREKRKSTDAMMLAAKTPSKWFAYHGDEWLEQLNKWLKSSSISERTLKSALQRWCLAWPGKHRKEMNKQEYVKSKSVAFSSVNTKAATILSKKFGAISQPEESNDITVHKRGRKKKSLGEGIVRCDCLELVWPSRIHCPCCHHSYETVTELQGHNNGACSWTGLEDEGQFLMTKNRMKLKGQEYSPPDLSVVLKKFTLDDSNRDRISQIGYLGSKGPKFVPAPMISPLLDPALHLALLYDDALSVTPNAMVGKVKIIEEPSSSARDSGRETQNNQHTPQKAHVGGNKLSGVDSPDQENAVAGSKILHKDRDNGKDISTVDRNGGLATYLQPAQSLDQRNMWAFKTLKMNLLDIESILSADVLEPSRSKPDRRRAWRSFVKSASTILELVQTLTLLEHMIKADCLKESWCNWTSLSAGVGISTLCSLALRIYSLDAAIKYDKSPLGDIEVDDSTKLNKTIKKKKMQG